MSWYENVIVPLLFLLFLIITFNPVLSETVSSRFLIFGSLLKVDLTFFVLKILTNFSACLTDNFFSIILFAINRALSNPTRTLAWPEVIFSPL